MAILQILLSAGTNGLGLFRTVAGPMLLVALVGTVLGFVAARRGARRVGGVFAAISVLTAIGAGVVIAQHARIATAQGVPVNVFSTVVPRLTGMGATADETRVYTQVDGHALSLDIYRPPRGTEGAMPVAIQIHGGGWSASDRTARAVNLRWLADHGYLGVSLDYVLATAERATWNTAAPQVACALTWVGANAASYGGDPARLFVFGDSAGGALALTTAYAAAAGVAVSSCGGQVPAVRAVAAQVPAVDPVTLYKNSDPIQGRRARRMVSQYLGGQPQDHPDRVRAVSTISFVTPKAPPTLLILADNDLLVPIEGTLQFIERAQQAGVPLSIVRFPWADHGAGALYYSVVNQTWLRVMQAHFCRYGGACQP